MQHTSIVHRLPIIIIFLLSTFLHLHGLADDSLWGDEIFTAIFASKSPLETIEFTASDIHPPFYYLLVGGLIKELPSKKTDWLWRFPSAMMAILTVAIVYRLTATLQNKRIGLIAGALLSVAPIMIKYGQEARMHALFMMLSALSTLMLAQAIKTEKYRYWIGYVIATTLNIYTMYFAFIIIAVHGIWIVSLHFLHFAKPQKRWSIAIIITLIAYLPWWHVLLKIIRNRAMIGAVEGGVGSIWRFMPKVVQSLGVDSWVWLFFGLYLVGLMIAWRRNHALAILGGAWLIFPSLMPIILGDPRALHLRYAFILPVYLIFVAIAVERVLRWKFGVLIPVVILMAISLTGVLTVYEQRKPDWRGAAQFVTSHAKPTDIIISGPLWDDGRFFSYYYPYPDNILRPPVFVSRLPNIATEMADTQSKVWLVSRYHPQAIKRFTAHEFYGVTVLESTQPEYDPVQLVNIAADVCRHAGESAYDWADEMTKDGVLTPDPRTAQAGAYHCQGEVYAISGDIERAIRPYKKMINAFPELPQGYIFLAEMYVALDDFASASEAYAQGIARNPKWQGTLADEAHLLVQAKQWQEAVEMYQLIIH